MTDKLKDSLMNQPEFVSGESPTNDKLNASFEQMRFALERIEKAVGDITDYEEENRNLSPDNLFLYTLGRNIGANNLAHIHIDGHKEYLFTDTLSLNRNYWYLPVVPKGTSNSLNYAITVGTARDSLGNDVFSSDVTPSIPSAPGEYAYYADHNAIISFLTLATGTATFTCTSYRGVESTNQFPFYSAGMISERLNVIPPREYSGTYISVSTSSNTSFDYQISINPSPLKYVTPLSKTSRERYDDSDIQYIGTSTKSKSGINRFATATNTYAFELPRSLSTYASGNELPRGHIYLFDEGNNNTVLTGTYYYRDNTSLFYKGIPLNTASTSTYRIINHGGLSNSELLEAMRFDLQYHEHYGPRAISHDYLRDLGGKQFTDISANYGEGWYRATVPSHHPHPQYLNRYGWDRGYDTSNLSNMMLGHIYLAGSSTNITEQTYSEALGSTDNDSFGLYFGSQNHYIRTKTSVAGQNYLAVRSYNIVLGGTALTSLENTYDLTILNCAPQSTVVASDVNASYVMYGGRLNAALLNSDRVSVMVTGEQAELDILDSTSIEVRGLMNDSDINIASCNNVSIDIVGKINGTFASQTDLRAEIVSTTLSDADIEPPFTGPGKYAYYDNYRIDAPRRRTKTYNPTKWYMFELDTSAGYLEYDYLVSANIPKFRIRSTATQNGAAVIGTNFDIGVFLELPDDSYVETIELGLTYQVATLRLYHYRIDGSAIEIASTSLPNMNGSSTSITWSLATAHGVMGERYPTVQNTAIDLLLVVENAATDEAGTNMTVHAGKAVYYEMRS